MMNERIRELAEQATTLSFDVDHTEREVDLEKFAELIVRECAMFIVVNLEDRVGSSIADATANSLEEYFGVE